MERINTINSHFRDDYIMVELCEKSSVVNLGQLVTTSWIGMADLQCLQQQVIVLHERQLAKALVVKLPKP